MSKFRRFLWIFIKRLYTILILLVSDPFDISDRWFHMNYHPPQFLFWVLLVVAIGGALCLSIRSYKSEAYKVNKLALRDKAYAKCKRDDHTWFTDERYKDVAYRYEYSGEVGDFGNIRERNFTKTCHFCGHSESGLIF